MYVSLFFGFFSHQSQQTSAHREVFYNEDDANHSEFPCQGAPLMHTEKLNTVPIRPLNRNRCEEAKAT